MALIRRVFIANRGEIARRIALAAKTMGIESVALFSGRSAPSFLRDCVSEFIQVEEESPSLYLDGELMVRFALAKGCGAVHPGFGFLSENAAFAQQVQNSGLTWIGPSPEAIAAMASKAAARDIAKRHDVPVVPGIEQLALTHDDSPILQVREFTRIHGFPILLKAALGGGGKGMRIVRKEDELAEAMRRAQSEAWNAFGDGSLIVERYIEQPRHIEVQILADNHGNIFALGDRDCSVQRRHQKIIEEAPAPAIGPSTRKKMHEAAIRLARSVAYSSAGTVEFLLDWDPSRREESQQQFYFLEMNTRLQVEHPVTEEVLNEDLVAWQFRIAQGESIRDRVNCQVSGHSIELRLYAEDTLRNFLPAAGPIHGFLPAQFPGVRWEIGIDVIDEVSSRFDPMMAKLIARGNTRQHAIERLILALKQTMLAIPVSNLSYLLSILHHPEFVTQQATTRFLSDHGKELQDWLERRDQQWQAIAHELSRQLPHSHIDLPKDQKSVAHHTEHAFQSKLAAPAPLRIHLTELHTHRLPLRFRDRSTLLGRGMLHQENSWHSFAFCRAQTPQGRISYLNLDGFLHSVAEETTDLILAAGQQANDQHIKAPVPGKVVKILIEAGAEVQEHQTVVILESMKMEFEIQASRSGSILEVPIREGQQVEADALLATWVPEASP